MSGECNICGENHGEGVHPKPVRTAYANGYEAGYADGYARATQIAVEAAERQARQAMQDAISAVECGVDDLVRGKVGERKNLTEKPDSAP